MCLPEENQNQSKQKVGTDHSLMAHPRDESAQQLSFLSSDLSFQRSHVLCTGVSFPYEIQGSNVTREGKSTMSLAGNNKHALLVSDREPKG